MDDIKLINRINDLQKKAIMAENSNYKNKLRPTKEMFSLYDQILDLYNKLSSQNKKTNGNVLYITCRNLGRLYFFLTEYEKVLYYLEKAKTLPEYENEEFMTKIVMDHFIVRSKLRLYLKSNSQSWLKNVRSLNNSLLNKADKIQQQQFKDAINHDNLLFDFINENINNNDIKTIIEFEIPSPLPIQENSPIKFKFNGLEHVLNIEIIENPASNIKGTGIPLIEDKYGLVKRSKINLTIPKYIDHDEHVEIKTFSGKKFTFKALLEAIDALNYFIEHYKIITGNYWVETVFFKMITKFVYEVKIGDQRFGNLIGIYDHDFFISSRIPYLNDAEIARLKNYLKIEEIPLWEILLLDAKDYLLRRDYRETIYTINGAFENYLMLKAREKLSKSWGQRNAIEYLEGKPIYEYHNLNKYISEENFNRAVKNKKIDNNIPPTGQILKECYKVDTLTISRTKLDKLVKKIRKRRNEVIHGVEIKDDLETIAFEAIESFEDFVKLF